MMEGPIHLESMHNLTSQQKSEVENLKLLDNRPTQFDKALGTKKACIVGLVFSVCTGIFFVVVGSLAQGSTHIFNLNPVAHELVPLGINIVVLLVTESLGYIHMVSLRWALLHENRLEFNANLRLFTTSKTNPANGLLANVLYFVAITMCYAASSMVFVTNTYDYSLTDGGDPWSKASLAVSLSKVTTIAMGSAILVLCLLSTWSLWKSKIPTWSSNPLTTLSAAMENGIILHREGRCMMSVHDRKKDAIPTRPTSVQQPPITVSTLITWILFGISATLTLLVFGMIIVIIVGVSNHDGGSWNIIPTLTFNAQNINSVTQSQAQKQTLTVFLSFFTSPEGSHPNLIHEPTMVGVLIFVMIVQFTLTIGLHCAELQVTLLRDEQVLRRMMSKDGTSELSLYNSVLLPFTSWQNVALLAFKPVIHWMFGSAMGVDYGAGILIRVPHVTYLTVLWVLFLAFVVQISYTKPRGSLPASYGHLQTMADIIDEWAPKMYWGDKGELEESEGGVRHAGTKGMPLPRIEMDALYS